MSVVLFIILVFMLGCNTGVYILVSETNLTNKKQLSILLPLFIVIMNIHCFIQIMKVNIFQSIVFIIYSITHYPLNIRLCIEILEENQAYNIAAHKLNLSPHPKLKSLFQIYEIIMVEEQEYGIKKP